jgi:GntR family transcriptional regulator
MSDHQRSSATAAEGGGALGFRPLYRQVRELLVRRIAEGLWAPGQPIPSEPEIASELGVSQGTVRKALDEMAAENLVVRRQGRGTYVARHDDARILFQFFRIVPDSGEKEFPDSRLIEVVGEGADEEAASALALRPGAAVVRLERVRSLAGEVCIAERIVVPAGLFPGLAERELPNNLYELYAAQFGIVIGRASEKLRAVAAGSREAELLGVAPGAALLRVDRTAFSIDGRLAEWRVSWCRTERVHYLSDLR